jgi:hypothetical protein
VLTNKMASKCLRSLRQDQNPNELFVSDTGVSGGVSCGDLVDVLALGKGSALKKGCPLMSQRPVDDVSKGR